MTYLLNCWYLFGWADELAPGQLLSRTICSQPIVMFRTAENVAAALHDRCPHRFAPLSLGTVRDDSIICGYHGLAFDERGMCSANPHGPIISSMRVASYPVIEAHAALWVWLGDAAMASPALLPDFGFVDDPLLDGSTKGYLHGAADYRLYVDNIMDLSHIDFLHATTIGGGSIVGTRQKVSDGEHTLRVRWSRTDVPASPAEVALGAYAGDLFDRVTEVVWAPPGNMRLTSAAGAKGSGEETFKRSIAAHVMTPETERTTHYFFLLKHNHKVGDAAFDQRLGAMISKVFAEEDSPMLAGVQQRMGDRELMSMSPILLKSDEAAIRVRRKLDAMIAAEARPT